MKNTLFILEEPYVSEFLLSTIEKLNVPVLKNKVSQNLKNKNLNLIEEKDIIKNSDGIKIYSNSENSIDWVIKNFPKSKTSELIKICKDKYKFRKSINKIYPDFYFEKISLKDIDTKKNLPERFIIKPAVGFLSMGVHKAENKKDWENIKKILKEEIKEFKNNFPESVLNSTEFIAEEIIEGEEYAIDAYFNQKGEPVILNIFQHPFVSTNDVSDRLYITSKEIIENNFNQFENLLIKIGKTLEIKNFPIHIEMIKTKKGEIIPVEINPMRFAGWCTTDLAYFAYGINVYESFYLNKKPNWEEILKTKKDEIYYFAMAETPQNIDKEKIKFNYEALKKEFSNILNFRKINYMEKPMFAVIFGETTQNSEITKILKLNMKDFLQ